MPPSITILFKLLWNKDVLKFVFWLWEDEAFFFFLKKRSLSAFFTLLFVIFSLKKKGKEMKSFFFFLTSSALCPVSEPFAYFNTWYMGILHVYGN